MALRTDDFSINTLVGADAFISGDLKVNGFIRVDGDIDGNLETTGNVIIGEKARIRGNVTAVSAVIGGIIEGDIVAPEGVKLFSSSSVLGDVITKRLQISADCLVQGQCVSVKDEEQFLLALENWQNEKAIRQKSILVSTGN
ncbi:MAG: polymer-forming cytoskeletal protein [Treponemataceae bacterium]|nr:polymer-forming cytoskeletal protein [Treponemataceae bacterium]